MFVENEINFNKTVYLFVFRLRSTCKNKVRSDNK